LGDYARDSSFPPIVLLDKPFKLVNHFARRLMLRVPARSLLPGRALLKKAVAPDGSVTQVGERKPPRKNEKLIHFVPKEYAADTIEFFRNSAKVKALAELIFTPSDPKDTPETRAEFESAVNAYKENLKASKLRYAAHEKRAEELCFAAIRELPPHLYKEAVLIDTTPFPRGLMFHARYNNQLFSSLSPEELIQLQTFENMSHTRFPHSEMKKRNPNLFLVAPDTLPSRQKEVALRNAANARSKTKK